MEQRIVSGRETNNHQTHAINNTILTTSYNYYRILIKGNYDPRWYFFVMYVSLFQGTIDWIESTNSSLDIFIYINGYNTYSTSTNDSADADSPVKIITNFTENQIAIKIIRNVVFDLSPVALRSSSSRLRHVPCVQVVVLALTIIFCVAHGRRIVLVGLFICFMFGYVSTQDEYGWRIVVYYPR